MNKKVIPQYALPSGYADIVIFIDDEIVVVELKVEALKFTHYLQLKGYIEDLRNIFKDSKKYRGILIGKQPKDDFKLILRRKEFNVRLLILNEDICTKIKICENCRLANDISNQTCLYCSQDIFLKVK